jgi:hypothetical protein
MVPVLEAVEDDKLCGMTVRPDALGALCQLAGALPTEGVWSFFFVLGRLLTSREPRPGARWLGC